MYRTARWIVLTAVAALLVGLLGALPATSVAQQPTARKLGNTAASGFLKVSLSNRADGRINVRWKFPRTWRPKTVKKWIVKTSTSRSMDQHVSKVRVGRKKHKAAVNHASLVTPASGAYTFVEVTAVRRKAKVKRSTSGTKWIQAPVTVTPTGAGSVTVGTFNIRSWNLENGSSDPYSWQNRKDRVVDTITGSGAGVVAIQEANGSTGEGYGDERQYVVFERQLGAPWLLSSNEQYRWNNKVNGRQGTRIAYDTSAYQLLDQGVLRIPGSSDRDMSWTPWAHFEQIGTGLRFTFISAHLSTANDSRGCRPCKYYELRNQQAGSIKELAGRFRTAYPGEQVIVAGDMNSSIYSRPDNGVQRSFISSGYYDAFATTSISMGNFPTTNGLKFPVEPAPHRRDYILTIGPVSGSYWYRNLAYRTAETVASDHFMQVASLPLS